MFTWNDWKQWHFAFHRNMVKWCVQSWDYWIFFTFILNEKYKQKWSKSNNGGIIVNVKDNLKDHVNLLKKVDDCTIRLNIRGISEDEYLLLCVCYNIPTGSSRGVFVNRSVFDLISDDMYMLKNQYDSKWQFLLAGNFNARNGKKVD